VELLTDGIPSPLGTIVIAARAGRLCAVDFEDCGDRMRAHLMSRYPLSELVASADPYGFSRALRAYLQGDVHAIDGLPVESSGTPFQEAVWSALRRVPPGQTITYTDLAHRAGRPAAVRAAGAANARNPLAIVVPCHRVIGRSGSLTGYAGGVSRKRWLLVHEGALPNTPRADALPASYAGSGGR